MDYENLYANRIGGSNFGKDTTIYKFEKIKRAKAKAIESNPNLEPEWEQLQQMEWMDE